MRGLLRYRKWIPHTDLLSGCGRTCVFAVQAWSNLWDLIWEPPSHYSMISPQFTPENKSQINQSLAMVILFVSSPGFTYSKWCRDGFGLGLGKNLHGFPRYNIEGSTEEGEVYNIYIHICHHRQSISIYLPCFHVSLSTQVSSYL